MKLFSVLMAVLVDREEEVPISIGTEINGLWRVTSVATIFLVLKCQRIVVVHNVSKLVDALTLHGRHTLVALAG